LATDEQIRMLTVKNPVREVNPRSFGLSGLTCNALSQFHAKQPYSLTVG